MPNYVTLHALSLGAFWTLLVILLLCSMPMQNRAQAISNISITSWEHYQHTQSSFWHQLILLVINTKLLRAHWEEGLTGQGGRGAEEGRWPPGEGPGHRGSGERRGIVIDKPKVGRTDAARLAEELIEIYSTPTPKGWMEPKK